MGWSPFIALRVRCGQHHSFRETSRLIPTKAAPDCAAGMARLKSCRFQNKLKTEPVPVAGLITPAVVERV
jgi:hypothetical protein